jgi:hypothetical protein
LFQSDQQLPNSQTQTLEAIMKHLERWSQSKPKKFKNALSWKIELKALSELTYLSFIKGRSVPQGMLLPDFYSQLVDTRLINLQNDNVSFWHRIFQAYLASFEIANQIQSGQILINEVIKTVVV